MCIQASETPLRTKQNYDSMCLNNFTRPTYNFRFLNRKAFTITETELKLIATAANIGESKIPKNGNKIPAAIGTPKVL